MPTTCPTALTSEPPESPGWMSQFVSMSPVRFSELPPPLSLAVIDWLERRDRPAGRTRGAAGAAGVADADHALDPLWRSSRRSVAVCRPQAPTSWITAMSPVRS